MHSKPVGHVQRSAITSGGASQRQLQCTRAVVSASLAQSGLVAASSVVAHSTLPNGIPRVYGASQVPPKPPLHWYGATQPSQQGWSRPPQAMQLPPPKPEQMVNDSVQPRPPPQQVPPRRPQAPPAQPPSTQVPAPPPQASPLATQVSSTQHEPAPLHA